MTFAYRFGTAAMGLVLGSVLGFAMLAPVVAQTLNPNPLEDRINKALQSPSHSGGGLTRGLGSSNAPTDPKTLEEQKFINNLRTRSIAVEPGTSGGAHESNEFRPSPSGHGAPTPPPAFGAEERARISEIASERPKIDLEVFFDYNSALINQRALPSLLALGNVLSRSEFHGTVFFINGYTDARGSAEYNQGLSQARASSVRSMLIDHFHLAPDTLIAVGFGKENLKIPDQPFADENRRVQIVNTEVHSPSAGR